MLFGRILKKQKKDYDEYVMLYRFCFYLFMAVLLILLDLLEAAKIVDSSLAGKIAIVIIMLVAVISYIYIGKKRRDTEIYRIAEIPDSRLFLDTILQKNEASIRKIRIYGYYYLVEENGLNVLYCVPVQKKIRKRDLRRLLEEIELSLFEQNADYCELIVSRKIYQKINRRFLDSILSIFSLNVGKLNKNIDICVRERYEFTKEYMNRTEAN